MTQSKRDFHLTESARAVLAEWLGGRPGEFYLFEFETDPHYWTQLLRHLMQVCDANLGYDKEFEKYVIFGEAKGVGLTIQEALCRAVLQRLDFQGQIAL